MFEGEVSDIKTRVEDRPARPFPHKLNDMADMPWLASRFNPSSEAARPSAKGMISKIIATGIPITGTLVILGVLAAFAVKVFSFYN